MLVTVVGVNSISVIESNGIVLEEKIKIIKKYLY